MSSGSMATESDSYFKSVRILSFSGKQADWSKWSLKFLANASVQGYKDILLGKEVAPTDSAVIDPSTEAGKKQLKLREKNKEAYNTLVLSCDDEVSLGAIETATSSDYKEGDAKQVWDNLLEIYQPRTMANKTSLIKELTKSSLSDASKNPDTWIDELENIRKRLKLVGVNKSDDELIMHVLSNLPHEYDTLVSILEHELINPNATLSLSKLRQELRATYQYPSKSTKKETNDEAYVSYRPLKGQCRNCGKIGHKAQHCRLNDNNKNSQNKNYGIKKDSQDN